MLLKNANKSVDYFLKGGYENKKPYYPDFF